MPWRLGNAWRWLGREWIDPESKVPAGIVFGLFVLALIAIYVWGR
jgi:hypothetical protein